MKVEEARAAMEQEERNMAAAIHSRAASSGFLRYGLFRENCRPAEKDADAVKATKSLKRFLASAVLTKSEG